MSTSRDKKLIMYEKPHLIDLGSKNVAEGQYCTEGSDWPACNPGGAWTGCNPGGSWPNCTPGSAWPGCVEGGTWEEFCVDGSGNLYECAMGDGVGGGDCIEMGLAVTR